LSKTAISGITATNGRAIIQIQAFADVKIRKYSFCSSGYNSSAIGLVFRAITVPV